MIYASSQVVNYWIILLGLYRDVLQKSYINMPGI